VVLRDTRNDRGTQFEAAQIEDDGTLRVTGHHTGPRVSESFGAAITSYDWAYVIAPDRTATLLTLLGGHTSDDVLDLLATYHTSMAARSTTCCEAPDRRHVQQLAQISLCQPEIQRPPRGTPVETPPERGNWRMFLRAADTAWTSYPTTARTPGHPPNIWLQMVTSANS
jgi:hypothetical protein